MNRILLDNDPNTIASYISGLVCLTLRKFNGREIISFITVIVTAIIDIIFYDKATLCMI